MAIVASFQVQGATAAKYDEVIRRLTAIGQKDPAGQIVHICHGDRENLQVVNVFESLETFQAFGGILGPILKEMGIEATPAITELYALQKM